MIFDEIQQKAITLALDPKKSKVFITGAGGTGKALSNKELVLTPKGFVKMKKIRVGDEVIGSTGKPINVIGVYPQGERTLYRMTFSDGSSVVCDKEHIWSVGYVFNQRTFSNKTTGELMGDLEIERDKYSVNKWVIPVAGVHRYGIKPKSVFSGNLLVNIILNGVITEHVADGDNGFLKIKTPTPELIAFGCTCNVLKASKRYNSREMLFSKSTKLFNQIMKEDLLSPFGNKIPKEFLDADLKTRVKIVSTFLNMYPNAKGCKFGNLKLAKDFKHIFTSLGYQLNIIQHVRKKGSIGINTVVQPHPNSEFGYYYTFTNPELKLTKAIVKIEKVGKGKATCIKVDAKDALFVVNGFNLTHNTQIINHLTTKIENLILLAPTNSAADNIKGKTIHAFARIRPSFNKMADTEDNALLMGFGEDDEENEDISNATIIIDEVSMLGKRFSKKVLKSLKCKKLILFGDPEQLKPVKDDPTNWIKFVDGNYIELKKNYRVTNQGVSDLISYFRNVGKLPYKLPKFKDSPTFTDNHVVVAYKNSTLSRLQGELLGYKTLMVGDTALSFGNSPVKNPLGRPVFKNGSKVVVGAKVSNPTLSKLGLDVFEVSDFETLQPFDRVLVVAGDYGVYKTELRRRFENAKYITKRLADAQSQPRLIKKLLNQDDKVAYNDAWINYFELKKIPYVRHHQFTTTYKAQGKGFEHVIVAWKDLPKEHRYTALSRAKQSIRTIR